MAPRETSWNGRLSSTSSVLFLFCLFLGATATEGAKMSLSDREALVKVKEGFGYPLSNPKLLKSWHLSNANCSKWFGVSCNSEGRVVNITLNLVDLPGTISRAIGNITFLKTLVIPLNRLHGVLPDTIVNLRYLEILDVSEQEGILGGPIPIGIGKLRHLKQLSLGFNKFNGTVPNSIGQLTKLKILELQYNNFEGRIPASIKNLKRLQQLYIFNNYFTGSLAIDADFESGLGVVIQDNYFSGPIAVTSNGKPFCSSIATNCLFSQNTTKVCGTVQAQRTVKECLNFCNTPQKYGACGGHGTCSRTTATCTCDKKYKLTLDKRSCYRR